MKTGVSWLNDHLDPPATAEEVAQVLTAVGFPIDDEGTAAEGERWLEVELTSNRGDCLSHLSLAREICAATGRRLKASGTRGTSTSSFASTASSSGEPFPVVNRVPDRCPLYTARVIEGVRVAPSPAWLRKRLESIGQIPRNNLVDATNFILFELGQPAHVFDLATLRGRRIEVRMAREGESFLPLGEGARAARLSAQDLVIADAERPVALAGIKGGAETAVTDGTTSIVVEAATFDPVAVRSSSRRLNIRSDSSHRFERGVHPAEVGPAAERLVALILELAGGTVRGPLAADGRPIPDPRSLLLRLSRVREVVGLEIPERRVEEILERLDLRPRRERSGEAGAIFRVTVPPRRLDLEREIDLVEEVVRLHGVDKIPSTPPRGAKGQHPFDATYDVWIELRRLLAGLGLTETQGQTLVAGDAARAVSPAVVALANPLSSDMDVLRPSLWPGLLHILGHNSARRNPDARLFEIGRVFNAGERGLTEGWRLAIALTGARNPAFWAGSERDAKADLADLKGVVEEVLEWFGLRGVTFTRRPEPTPLLVESASIALGGKLDLGQLGQVQPVVARRHDLRDPVLLAELNLDVLLARRNVTRSAKPLPAFPSIQRDVAMLVDESVTHDAVLAAVRGAKPANLEAVELFDIFRGGPVPKGQKSVAYSFTYRAADRTLKDEEVTAAHQRVVEAFVQGLKATLR